MIKTDYTYSYLKMNKLKKYERKLNNIVRDFERKECEGNDFIGWYEYPNNISDDLLECINKDANKIKKMCDVFVVCGIGGSYLGARAVIEAIKGYKKQDVEIIYVGNTFDELYLKDVLSYLDDKHFCVNVISKSGSTLETAVAFRFLRKKLEEKYGENYYHRVFVTTDETKGCLNKIAKDKEFVMYGIPDDIGGRYSVFTPVGLLPMAVAGVDICSFVKGARLAYSDLKKKNIEENIAYQYAAYRYINYKKGKSVEIQATYSPYLNMLSEWWKQLFGESEGKDDKGLFPSSVNFSTDLHSLGQFIQQGKKCFFISQLMIRGENNLKLPFDEEDDDGLNYLSDIYVNEMNLCAQEGTNKAHHDIGGVDNFTFAIKFIDETSLGYLMYVFMFSCMLSASLLKVNPFNQPGVEFYKKEMKKILKK